MDKDPLLAPVIPEDDARLFVRKHCTLCNRSRTSFFTWPPILACAALLDICESGITNRRMTDTAASIILGLPAFEIVPIKRTLGPTCASFDPRRIPEPASWKTPNG